MLRAIYAWIISWVPIQPRFRWRLDRRTSCHCARLNGGYRVSGLPTCSKIWRSVRNFGFWRS